VQHRCANAAEMLFIKKMMNRLVRTRSFA